MQYKETMIGVSVFFVIAVVSCATAWPWDKKEAKAPASTETTTEIPADTEGVWVMLNTQKLCFVTQDAVILGEGVTYSDVVRALLSIITKKNVQAKASILALQKIASDAASAIRVYQPPVDAPATPIDADEAK